MLKTPKCYNSTNIARIAFRVVGINFWAQFTPKIKLQFFILVLPPPCLMWQLWFFQQVQSESLMPSTFNIRKFGQDPGSSHKGLSVQNPQNHPKIRYLGEGLTTCTPKRKF